MASLLENLLNPISAASYAGDDGSYDTDFEAAKAEADKSSENNFHVMEESSKKFLVEKSKDMRVLGYLTWASAMNHGANALAECVQAYCKIVVEHWDEIHPKRPAARSNALKWLNGERLVSQLSAISPSGNYETLLAASEELDKLYAFCGQKFPEGPPSFMSFSKIIKELTEKNKPKPVEAASDSTASSSSEPTASAPGAITNVDEALMAVQNGAYFLMEANKSNPFPYRLVRMLKWDPIQAVPPSTGGNTMIPAPYAAALEAFQNLCTEQSWTDLAKNGEDAFSSDGMLFWFDLQRFICSALLGLGPEFAASAKGIRIELALLFSRLPSLWELNFDDGTPFADAITKEWIQTEVLTTLGSGGGGGPAPVKKKGDVGEEQKQAQSLFGEGKLDQALNVLRTGVANDSNEKNNFDRKLIMAELCFKANKPNIARAILTELHSIINNYSLLKWDSELCVSVFHLTQKVYLSLYESAEDGLKLNWREKALEMHSQISTLDPVLAVASEIK